MPVGLMTGMSRSELYVISHLKSFAAISSTIRATTSPSAHFSVERSFVQNPSLLLVKSVQFVVETDDKKCSNMLRQWVHRKYILQMTDDSFRKNLIT